MDTTKIIDVEVEDVYGWDYPDLCDAYVVSAAWKDTGIELTEAELDELNDAHGDFVHEKAHESLQ